MFYYWSYAAAEHSILFPWRLGCSIIGKGAEAMCLGIPVKLIARSEREGIGDIGGVQRRISLILLPEAKVGDYVLIHAGCGIQIIDEQAAMETLELLRMLEDEIH